MIPIQIDMEETEIPPPIFPKGIHQMLSWVYAMEGNDPHEKSAHAKMIERMDDGDLRPFSLGGINLSGLSEIEKFAFAASIRSRVESITDEDERMVIWARYCGIGDRGDGVKNKIIGMEWIAKELAHILGKSSSLIGDCVFFVVCTEKQREKCRVDTIARINQVSPSTIDRTIRRVKGYMDGIYGVAKHKIRKTYPNGDVI